MIAEPDGKHDDMLADIQAFFLEQSAPMCFNPYEEKNILRSSEMIFEDLCSVIEEQGVINPKRLSEFEFYSKLRYYEKKFKEAAK
jgi:hypothetical protein